MRAWHLIDETVLDRRQSRLVDSTESAEWPAAPGECSCAERRDIRFPGPKITAPRVLLEGSAGCAEPGAGPRGTHSAGSGFKSLAAHSTEQVT